MSGLPHLVKSAFAAVLAAVVVSAPSAQPAPLFTLDFGAGSISSNDPLTGAAGSIGFTFADENDDVRVSLDIKNTTGQATFGAGATESKLTGFGFDLIEDIAFAGGFTSTGFLDTVIEDAKFDPFGRLDLAVADNGNFLGGNANGALAEGQTTVVTFLFDSDLNAAALGDAYQQAFLFDGTAQAGLRFQQVNAGEGSDKLIHVGSPPIPPSSSVSSVPVPASLPLLASVIAFAGFAARRRGKS